MADITNSVVPYLSMCAKTNVGNVFNGNQTVNGTTTLNRELTIKTNAAKSVNCSYDGDYQADGGSRICIDDRADSLYKEVDTSPYKFMKLSGKGAGLSVYADKVSISKDTQ